ncbi:unnamed protein product [Mycena citricolor]|uniref:Uncharacterized protein n=1 Tax=Mycena citricolor TaxID=2018698 RepID=A0AAD2JW82_9AGAR|nr:unnamed protein product [Mycena citricolor]
MCFRKSRKLLQTFKLWSAGSFCGLLFPVLGCAIPLTGSEDGRNRGRVSPSNGTSSESENDGGLGVASSKGAGWSKTENMAATDVGDERAEESQDDVPVLPGEDLTVGAACAPTGP